MRALLLLVIGTTSAHAERVFDLDAGAHVPFLDPGEGRAGPAIAFGLGAAVEPNVRVMGRVTTVYIPGPGSDVAIYPHAEVLGLAQQRWFFGAGVGAMVVPTSEGARAIAFNFRVGALPLGEGPHRFGTAVDVARASFGDQDATFVIVALTMSHGR